MDNQKHSNFCETSLAPVIILTPFNRLNNYHTINLFNLFHALSAKIFSLVLVGNIEMKAAVSVKLKEKFRSPLRI